MEYQIWDAAILLNPLPAERDHTFQLKLPKVLVGQSQRYPEPKESLLSSLAEATSGSLRVHDMMLILPRGGANYQYKSEMAHRDRWFSEAHLQVIGRSSATLPSDELGLIDDALRASSPPFDGLSDVSSWLGLKAPMSASDLPTISIRVNPPVDIIIDQCRLSEDRLQVTLHAHPQFDVGRVRLAVRALPGKGLSGRLQVSDRISWGSVQNGRREGVVQVSVAEADNVLVILMIGDTTIRRRWFIDPARARNQRLLAVQQFDKDLRMVRHALFESTNPSKFETGVAALLFLLGFSSTVQLETDSPDLLAATPAGRLVVIECTTRIADVASKVGKLVDRRGALLKALQASGHAAQVVAILACRLPKDQIAVHGETMRSHNTILVAAEELTAGLERVRFPTDPDALLDELQTSQLVERVSPS
jgi:hypothetical protein